MSYFTSFVEIAERAETRSIDIQARNVPLTYTFGEILLPGDLVLRFRIGLFSYPL